MSSLKVLISEIPPDLDEDDLIIYLENKRDGGGDIQKIEFDRGTHTAVAVFEDCKGSLDIFDMLHCYLFLCRTWGCWGDLTFSRKLILHLVYFR